MTAYPAAIAIVVIGLSAAVGAKRSSSGSAVPFVLGVPWRSVLPPGSSFLSLTQGSLRGAERVPPAHRGGRLVRCPAHPELARDRPAARQGSLPHIDHPPGRRACSPASSVSAATSAIGRCCASGSSISSSSSEGRRSARSSISCPGNKDLFLRRFVCGFDFSSLLVIGVGAIELARLGSPLGGAGTPRLEAAAVSLLAVVVGFAVLAPAWTEVANYTA